jgi:uncharacterized repeat protein (TIGR04076 family)
MNGQIDLINVSHPFSQFPVRDLYPERRILSAARVEVEAVASANDMPTHAWETGDKCAVYKADDKISVDRNILPRGTESVCTDALSTLLHYVSILEHDWCPTKPGLTACCNPDRAYLQCVDPGESYTEGGTVVFECRRIKEGSSK